MTIPKMNDGPGDQVYYLALDFDAVSAGGLIDIRQTVEDEWPEELSEDSTTWRDETIAIIESLERATPSMIRDQLKARGFKKVYDSNISRFLINDGRVNLIGTIPGERGRWYQMNTPEEIVMDQAINDDL